jgi:hypothetical protein
MITKTEWKQQAYGHEHYFLLHLGEDLSGVSFRLRMNRLVEESEQDLAKVQHRSLLESAAIAPDDG